MKRLRFILSFLVSSLIGLNSTHATQHIILAQGVLPADDIFVPYETYAIVGDTIVFVYMEGTHTTEAVSIPVGAATFASDLTSNVDTFTYVVTVPGTYYFDCHYDLVGGHGMDGYIYVTDLPTAVGDINLESSFTIFPNPFTDHITIESLNVDEVKVYNIVGQEVHSRKLSGNQSLVVINTKEFRSGIYFISMIEDGHVLRTQKLTKN